MAGEEPKNEQTAEQTPRKAHRIEILIDCELNHRIYDVLKKSFKKELATSGDVDEAICFAYEAAMEVSGVEIVDNDARTDNEEMICPSISVRVREGETSVVNLRSGAPGIEKPSSPKGKLAKRRRAA